MKKRRYSKRGDTRWQLSLVMAFLSLLCLCWSLLMLHPSSGAAGSVGKKSLNIVSALDAAALRMAPAGEAEAMSAREEQVRIHYSIPREDTVAPPPLPEGYGTIPWDAPEQVEEVLDRAREYGLLGEDETVAFDPGAEFSSDRDIEYYLDETILSLCWKEVIDGCVCSFAEVKIADASQLRRKFADDTFGSPNRYFSTEMHKSTNAVITMNADFYQHRDFGIVVYQGELCRFPRESFGKYYTKYNCLETCFVNADGDFLYSQQGMETTEEELQRWLEDNNILFSISFGPVLVQDGAARQIDAYPVGEIDGGYVRAGIGQMGPLHYLYMCVSNSPKKAADWTVNQFARHYAEKHVRSAYCLDGGQTAEIVFRDGTYNYIEYMFSTQERPVSDNIYFATAIGGVETEVRG